VGLHDRSWFDGRGPRFVAMVSAIFVLAPLIVLLRLTLVPVRTQASPAAVGQSRDALSGPSCPAGEGCVRAEDTPATQPTASATETRLVDLVNGERGRSGCPVLQLNGRLMASARAHAADMASRSFAGHVNPDNEGPEVRARKKGYQGGVTELIAAGLPNVDEVFAQWTSASNPAALPVRARMNDCSRVSVGVAHLPGRVKPTFGDGIWVLEMGDT
jgi:hypothetical protein